MNIPGQEEGIRIYDISMDLKPGMIAYPGTPPCELLPVSRIAKGGSSNTSLLSFGTHAGTHVDAPGHVVEGAGGIEAVPPETLLGPARVLNVLTGRHVEKGDLEGRLDGVKRVLLRTRNSEGRVRAAEFDPDFAALSASGAEYLASLGVLLVGVDYLSVDRFKSGTHPAHSALIGAGVTILEGLDLSEVPEGDYELFCGPLRIPSGDGAPARAFLVRR